MWPEPIALSVKLYDNVEEDSRFREGDRHLRQSYDDDEKELEGPDAVLKWQSHCRTDDVCV